VKWYDIWGNNLPFACRPVGSKPHMHVFQVPLYIYLPLRCSLVAMLVMRSVFTTPVYLRPRFVRHILVSRPVCAEACGQEVKANDVFVRLYTRPKVIWNCLRSSRNCKFSPMSDRYICGGIARSDQAARTLASRAE
jgi:hypothetical protein